MNAIKELSVAIEGVQKELFNGSSEGTYELNGTEVLCGLIVGTVAAVLMLNARDVFAAFVLVRLCQKPDITPFDSVPLEVREELESGGFIKGNKIPDIIRDSINEFVVLRGPGSLDIANPKKEKVEETATVQRGRGLRY